MYIYSLLSGFETGEYEWVIVCFLPFFEFLNFYLCVITVRSPVFLSDLPLPAGSVGE